MSDGNPSNSSLDIWVWTKTSQYSDPAIPGAMPLSLLKTAHFKNDYKPLAGSARELSSFPVTLPSSLTVLQLNTHITFYRLTQANQGAECYHCNPIAFIWVAPFPHLPNCPSSTLSFFLLLVKTDLFISGILYATYFRPARQPNWIGLSLHRATLTEHGVINERNLSEKVPALRWLIYGCTWGWQRCSPAEWWQKGLLCSLYIRLMRKKKKNRCKSHGNDRGMPWTLELK